MNQVIPTKKIDCDGTVGNLWGIATAKNNMWAVTDEVKHCVYIFDNQDQLVNRFGQKGSKKGEFNKPLGVAFDSNDHLYAVDGVNHRVQKFDNEGKYLLEALREMVMGSYMIPLASLHIMAVYILLIIVTSEYQYFRLMANFPPLLILIA